MKHLAVSFLLLSYISSSANADVIYEIKADGIQKIAETQSFPASAETNISVDEEGNSLKIVPRNNFKEKRTLTQAKTKKPAEEAEILLTEKLQLELLNYKKELELLKQKRKALYENLSADAKILLERVKN